MPVLIFASLLCLGWLVPDHFPPWQAFHNEAPVFLGLILAALIMVWRRKLQRWQVPAGLFPSLALMGIALAQYVFGQLVFAGDLWLVWLYVGGFGLAWLLGHVWAEGGEKTHFTAFDTLVLAFATGATVSALMCFVQWFELEGDWAPWVMSAAHSTRAIANLAQPNQLSTLLLTGVIATAVLYERRRVSGELALLLIGLQSLAAVLTQSRTGLLVVVMLVITAWWGAKAWRQVSFRQVFMWGLAFVFLSLLFQWGAQGTAKAAIGGQALQVGTRPLLWQQFAAALSESPWLGYGWLQTVRAQEVGALTVPGQEQATYTHNHLLDLAIWLGLPLTLLLIAWISLIVWQRRKGLHEPKVVMALFCLLPIGCHALLEFPLAYAYFLFPAGVLLGMMDRWTEGAKVGRVFIPAVVTGAFVASYALLASGVVLDYVAAEEDFRVARFENRKLGETPADYKVPELKLLDQLRTMLRALRLKATPNMAEAEIELLAKASNRYFWTALHFKYALALGLNGRPEQATRELELIRGLFGEKIYAAVREDFLRLQREVHPQLERVMIP
ncbi:PglL family O-oligosaccharyltransferase [Rhodoferax sp. BAB1]|uniref:PglL family O-oligosaccharyltransferase n=1 Tax=Rhodoferax sp. BAB1 TaxID=2741720 RepID=UPI001576603A|nr:O-antigen ligase family protein [Rhodoferax sp. BAB1]QKO23472.1 O-antigen ligase C-terminal domain-containing protein [Rhodoferax sp. BAB1]